MSFEFELKKRRIGDREWNKICVFRCYSYLLVSSSSSSSCCVVRFVLCGRFYVSRYAPVMFLKSRERTTGLFFGLLCFLSFFLSFFGSSPPAVLLTVFKCRWLGVGHTWERRLRTFLLLPDSCNKCFFKFYPFHFLTE